VSSLRAPIAVTVEVRAAGQRVFRLAANVGEDGVALERPAPFERGRPVEIAFAMPTARIGCAWTRASRPAPVTTMKRVTGTGDHWAGAS